MPATIVQSDWPPLAHDLILGCLLHLQTKCKIWEAARATSAAPTYFQPANIDGHWFVDGGLVANDPSMAALTEAAALFGGTENINMLLSVGSGHRESVPIDVNPNPWLWNLANDVVKAW